MIFNGINFLRITTLALADSVNPCAIAVLTMVLVSILIHNPENKKRVLYSGIGFMLAVFIGYIFYGIVMIEFFKVFANFLRDHSFYLFNGLAILAMILGALNIRDYFSYRPGGLATEMPMKFRPYAKLAINGITSPWGAFVIGFFVTVFLLPCTIGPYIIASGLLSNLGILGSLPWLVYYNILFLIPMAFIIGIVYYGFSKIEDISGWKERNIRRLHLAAGILLFCVGIALLMGWL